MMFALHRDLPTEAKRFARLVMANVREAGGPTTRMIDRIIAALSERLRTGRTLRPELLAEAARQWTTDVGTTYRLAPLTVHVTRKTLVIRDVRLAVGTSALEDDPGPPRDCLSIALLQLEVDRKRVTFDAYPVGVVQAHAIARWHQRTFRPVEPALLTDLAVLAQVYERVLSEAERTDQAQFVVQAGDGAWAGVVTRASGKSAHGKTPCCTVKTFLSVDARSVVPRPTVDWDTS